MKNDISIILLALIFTIFLIFLTACGEDGARGPAGVPGADGRNGTNGEQGPTGPQGGVGSSGADAILEVINPCGDDPAHDEVILRLSGGRLLAHYSSGGKQFLTLLQANTTYSTTDGHACTFTVDSAMNISY